MIFRRIRLTPTLALCLPCSIVWARNAANGHLYDEYVLRENWCHTMGVPVECCHRISTRYIEERPERTHLSPSLPHLIITIIYQPEKIDPP
jgi:hypothetical protein